MTSRCWMSVPLVAAVMACGTQSLSAQTDDLIVRVAADPSDSVIVGQRVRLRMDVLAREIWANLPGFSPIDVPGAIVIAPADNSVRLSEQLRGGNFIGQRYELWIYPQRQGKLRIPRQELNVQLKPFGLDKEPTVQSAKTEPLELDVQYPDGVPVGAKLLCASDFTARQSWQPSSARFRVGDGITRTVTRTIGDAPAMILETITTAEVPGARTYPKQPELTDRFDRGNLVGKRIDSATYVFDRPGEVILPELTFQWWDLGAGNLQTTKLDGIKLDIAPAATETATGSAGRSSPAAATAGTVLAIVIALIAVLAVAFRYRDLLLERVRRRCDEIAESEAGHFRRFAAAAKSGDPNRSLRELMRWLDIACESDTAPRLDQFLLRHGDPQARRQVAALEAAVDSRSDSTVTDGWDADDLVTAMKRARRHWLAARRQRQTSTRKPLPPLRSA